MNLKYSVEQPAHQKQCSAPLWYFVYCNVFVGQIVSEKPNDLKQGKIDNNGDIVGYTRSPEPYNAIANNTVRGNSEAQLAEKQPKAFVVPGFYRRLKEKVRTQTPKMLQTVKQYCHKNIGQNRHLDEINKNNLGRIYFDIFHRFAYCPIDKVCTCFYMLVACAILLQPLHLCKHGVYLCFAFEGW